MKYKLLKPIKGIPSKVGEELSWEFLVEQTGCVTTALLEHCGFIEEVKEWKADELKYGDVYWFIKNAYAYIQVIDCNWYNDKADKFRLKTNNIFQSKEDAEKRLKEIIES